MHGFKKTIGISLMLTAGTPFSQAFVIERLEHKKLLPTKNKVQRKNIKLHAGEFDPLFEALKISGDTRVNHNRATHGLVQFHDGVKQSVEYLDQVGVDVLAYLAKDTYLVKWDAKQKAQLDGLTAIRFAGDYQPAYKISLSLLAKLQSAKTQHPPELILEVVGFADVSLKQMGDLIKKVAPSAEVLRQDALVGMPHMVLKLRQDIADTVLAMLHSDDVAWVDHHLPMDTRNVDSVGPIQSNTTGLNGASLWDQGLIGTGQIVAVVDRGLDRNQDFFSQYDTGAGGVVVRKYTDADFPAEGELGELHPEHKVVGYFVQPGASPYEGTIRCNGSNNGTYHGSHVAGTVAGDSGTPADANQPNYDPSDGMAPHAQLLIQDMANNETGCFIGRGGYPMFKQAAKAGAWISSNSYGTVAEPPVADGYKLAEFEIDKAAYELEDQLIVFAAGNDGALGLGHPSHAKNMVAVGSLGHGNSLITSTFSSVGPAYDGRIKPDIMAPGENVVSSSGDGDDTVPPAQLNAVVVPLSGTSMATPAVSGGAALMRQYFMDGFYPSGEKTVTDAMRPSGSLMKSVLLNGTVLNNTIPSNSQGWGRIWLDNNLYFAGDQKQLRVWDLPNANGLATNEAMTFKVQVGEGQDLRVTLSWFDPPAALGNGAALVNDLDLELSFAGQRYWGNHWIDGQSQTGGVADKLNNVEQIHIPHPDSGEYTITVKGSSVNGSDTVASRKQGFALVSSQQVCETNITQAPEISLSLNAEGDPRVTVDTDGIQIYRKLGGCEVDNSAFKFVGQINAGDARREWSDSGTERDRVYGYALRGVDACGEGPYSACKSITSQTACQLIPAFNASSLSVDSLGATGCGFQLSWQAAQNSCDQNQAVKYNVYRSDDINFAPGPQTLLASGVRNSNYLDTDIEPLSVYHYIVTAVDALGNESFNRKVKSAVSVAAESTAGDYVEDADLPGLAVLGHAWQRSNSRSSTGNLSFHHAEPGFYYEGSTCSYLTLPAVDVQQTGTVLSFDAAYRLEENWDGVLLEVSTDGGASWQELIPDGGYPSSFSQTEPTPGQPINACGFAKTRGAFSGVQNTFSTYTKNLSEFAGQQVKLRWAFSSDVASQDEGFYLDNIKITNSSTPNACEVSLITKETSGPWYNPAQSGHGFFIEMLPGNNSPDRLNGYWYTFLDGKPQWIVGQGEITQGDAVQMDMFTTTGANFPPDFAADDVVFTEWGSLAFEFNGPYHAQLSWDSLLPAYGAGSMPLSKLALMSEAAEACVSGSYYDPQQSGHGFSVLLVGEGDEQQLLVSWYAYHNGEQLWLYGQGQLLDGQANLAVFLLDGADFPPGFNAADVVSTEWGRLQIEFKADDKMAVSWVAGLPGFADGQINTVKFTEHKGRGCVVKR